MEYLRATGSSAHRRVRRLLLEDKEVHTTDVVVMELLAGARGEGHSQQLRRLLAGCEYLPVQGLADYEAAAGLYRTCRGAGETIRTLTDCLVATVALRTGLAVLHADRDFEVLARHAGLQVWS